MVNKYLKKEEKTGMTEADVQKMLDSHIQTVNDQVDAKLTETVDQVIEGLRNVPMLQGQPGKDANEQAIVDKVLSKFPKQIDEEQLTAKILSKVPKANDIAKSVLDRIPKSKSALKVVQEKIEIDPMGVIDKILSLPPEKFKLKTDNIDGFSQTISAFQNQLGMKGYLHGSGLSNITGLIQQGTNVTITGTGTTIDPYIINSSGGGGGNPGGSDTNVQFNDSNTFGGDSNFWWDNTLKSLTVGTPASVLNGLAENAFNVNGDFGGLGSPDFVAISNHNSSQYGSTDHIVSNDADDGTVLSGIYGDFGIAGSNYQVNGDAFDQSNDVYLYSSFGAGNLNLAALNTGKKIQFATAGDTVDSLRMDIASDKVTVYANKDVELIPAFTGGNWTAAGGWSVSGGNLVETSNAGPNTIQPTVALAITPGITYYVVIEASATSGVISYTLGGVPGSAITAGTTVDFLTAVTSGNLIITGAASTTATITSISVRALVQDTGNLEAQGNLILGSGIRKPSGTPVMTIDGDGVATFSQIPYVPVALPTQDYQVANKFYVDTFSQGLVPYQDVQLFATVANGNRALTGEQTLDGVLTSTSNVILNNQTAPEENGVWVTAAGAWSRRSDFNSTPEIKMGAFFYVTAGSTNAGNRYAQYLFNPASDTLGIDPIGFTLISQAGFGVSNFSFVNANGFSGSVINPSTTPALTLTTTITGMVRGNGTALQAAGTGTDNHIIRYNGTNNIQDSELIISDIVGGVVTMSTLSSELQIEIPGGTTGNAFGVTVLPAVSGSGGFITLTSGDGAGSSTGGTVNISSGSGGATGLGGAFIISAGNGGSTSGNGGTLRIYGGGPGAFAGNNDGGDIWLTPGHKTGSGSVGKLRIYPSGGASYSANLDSSLMASSDKTFTFPNQTGIIVATPDPGANTIYMWDDTDNLPVNALIGAGLTYTHSTHTLSASGVGDFVGPASSTDNAVVRFDGTTGKLGQNSLLIVSDTGLLTTANGSVTNPSYSFTLSTNTGMYLAGATLSFALAGNSYLELLPTATRQVSIVNSGTAALPTITFGGDTTTGIYRPGAAQIGIAVAGVARLTINSTTTTIPTGNLAVSAGSILSASGTLGVGYSTGAGGTVTQLTSKSTAVTLNKICGQITMNNAALAAGAEVSFTLTNSTIAATDVVHVSIASGATAGAYLLTVGATGAGSCSITLSNASAGSLSQAIVLNFAVLKSVAS